MSEARELLGRFLNRLLATQTTLIAAADLKAAMTFGEIAEDVQEALAAPAPDEVPGLPEFVRDESGGHTICLDGQDHSGFQREYWLPPSLSTDDLDRIAEACRIIAARRRADEIPPLA